MRQHKLTLLIVLVFLFESGALIITGQNPFDEQQDNVLNVDRIPSDTTIVFDTGTESAFPFLATPFLPIALLMLSLLLMPRPVVQAAVQAIVPVIVPTPVPTPVPATQIRDISQLSTVAEKSSELVGNEEPSTIYSTLAPEPPCVPTSCPEGYIISNDLTASINCYFFGGADEQTWTYALNICRMKGAYLWAPNTVAEAVAVKSTTGFGNNVDIWTGLYSPTSDENFEFVDAGGVFTLDTLPFGERDAIDNDDCVEFELTNSNNWNWDDDPCDRAQQYMCEFPMKTCP